MFRAVASFRKTKAACHSYVIDFVYTLLGSEHKTHWSSIASRLRSDAPSSYCGLFGELEHRRMVRTVVQSDRELTA
jgi:hypothetical protein